VSEQGRIVRYFFALDLVDAVPILPALMAAVVEAIRFLGPRYCALSIVVGQSKDNTWEILELLRQEIKDMSLEFHLTSSDIKPKESNDRIQGLADLRNLALQKLFDNPNAYSSKTMVIFLNDLSLCVDDILELLYQLALQKADMTCAMDWAVNGQFFYDVWVARGINGDTFFEIPQSGSWDFASNLFWNDPKTRKRLDAMQPFQVYACWNGITTFHAKPLLDHSIRFRSQQEGECFMGEPTYLCKDLWRHGYSKIAVVPSVNVAYSHNESVSIKTRLGSVSDALKKAASSDESELINWQKEPPAMVKCARMWTKPSWVPPL
jgi:alpha-1,3-mannosyltransferase